MSHDIPSYYILTKTRPNIENFVLDTQYYKSSLLEEDIICINSTKLEDRSLVPLSDDKFPSYIGNTNICLELEYDEQDTVKDIINASKIYGCYDDYVTMMAKNIEVME